MPIYLEGGRILLDGGEIAMSEDCCCEEGNTFPCYDIGSRSDLDCVVSMEVADRACTGCENINLDNVLVPYFSPRAAWVWFHGRVQCMASSGSSSAVYVECYGEDSRIVAGYTGNTCLEFTKIIPGQEIPIGETMTLESHNPAIDCLFGDLGDQCWNTSCEVTFVLK